MNYVLCTLLGAFAAVAVLELRARLYPPTPAIETKWHSGPMTRARAIALGREHAQKRVGDHRYLEDALTDAQWTPHEWVLLAIEDAYERGAVECPF